MLFETVQYYDENRRQPVYVLQLDASKAFDRVSYSRLFNVLLDKNVCPYIARLLCYMYLNQNCCVKWNSKKSTDFSVSNGVKQGAVIFPILFSSYMDAKKSAMLLVAMLVQFMLVPLVMLTTLR